MTLLAQLAVLVLYKRMLACAHVGQVQDCMACLHGSIAAGDSRVLTDAWTHCVGCSCRHVSVHDSCDLELPSRDAVQAAVGAVVPTDVQRKTPFTAAQRSAQTRRHDLPEGERPEEWSAWRAYGMTGITPGPGVFVRNEWGGAVQPLRLYDADRSASSRAGETSCTQAHASQAGLGSGLMV